MNNIAEGFRRGLVDFVCAPYRLFRMHTQIVSMRGNRRRTMGVRDQQAQRRLQLERASERPLQDASLQSLHQLKERGRNSFSAEPTNSNERPIGILQPLFFMWAFNVSICAVLASIFTFSPAGALVEYIYSKRILGLAASVIAALLHLLLLIVTDAVTLFFLKKITSQMLHLVSQEKKSSSSSRGDLKSSSSSAHGGHAASSPVRPSNAATAGATQVPALLRNLAFTASSSSSIGGSIVDRLYAVIFYVLYGLQFRIIVLFFENQMIRMFLCILPQAFLYSCYSFEYLWRTVSGATFEKFLMSVVHFWPYFLGYGTPLGTVLALLPDTIGWASLVLSVTYPILVIGALSVPWHPCDLQPSASQFRAVVRAPLAVSTWPAIWLANGVFNVIGRLMSRLSLAYLNISPPPAPVRPR